MVGNGTPAPADLRVIGSELAGVAPGQPVAVVPVSVLRQLVPDARADALVVYGPTATAGAIQAALPLTATYGVQTRTAYLDALSADALAGSIDRVALACGLGSALFALAALLLELLATAPERGRSVAFLRTVGLRWRAAAGVLIRSLTLRFRVVADMDVFGASGSTDCFPPGPGFVRFDGPDLPVIERGWAQGESL